MTNSIDSPMGVHSPPPNAPTHATRQVKTGPLQGRPLNLQLSKAASAIKDWMSTAFQNTKNAFSGLTPSRIKDFVTSSGDGAIPSRKGHMGKINRSCTLMNPFSKTAKTSSKVAAIGAIVLGVAGIAITGAGFGSVLGAPIGAIGLAMIGAAAGLSVYAFARKGIASKGMEIINKTLDIDEKVRDLLGKFDNAKEDPIQQDQLKKEVAKLLTHIDENMLPMATRLNQRIEEFWTRVTKEKDLKERKEPKGDAKLADLNKASDLLKELDNELYGQRLLLDAQKSVLLALRDGKDAEQALSNLKQVKKLKFD
ncbi:MAG: hypothetical protein K0S07_1091 [Chlamydiales bacterium]|nr:hypothetical protein [Chlamydiales bacterium]